MRGSREGAEETQEMFRSFTNLMYVNCWSVVEHELVEMWTEYVGTCDGVAIQSTFRQMCDCLQNSDEPVRIGMVQYEDFSTFTTYLQSAMPYTVLKRQEFHHEHEIRMIFMPDVGLSGYSGAEELAEAVKRIEKEDGHIIPVDLKVLIEQVYVSPFSGDWLVDLIKAHMEKADLDPSIVIQ